MITKKSKIWKYFSRLFLSIDQLGNALAGGDPDNTISARVGYYNHHYFPENEKVPWYWSVFEKIINVTFYPADGPNHCHEAYHNDAGEIFDNRLTDILVAIAATIIIIPSCIAIAFVLYLLSVLGIVKRKTIERYAKSTFARYKYLSTIGVNQGDFFENVKICCKAVDVVGYGQMERMVHPISNIDALILH